MADAANAKHHVNQLVKQVALSEIKSVRTHKIIKVVVTPPLFFGVIE